MASSDAQNAFSTGIGANPHGGDSGPGDIPWPLWAKAAARSAWLTAEFKRLNHLGDEGALRVANFVSFGLPPTGSN